MPLYEAGVVLVNDTIPPAPPKVLNCAEPDEFKFLVLIFSVTRKSFI